MSNFSVYVLGEEFSLQKSFEAYEWCVENQDVSESFFVQVNSIHIC